MGINVNGLPCAAGGSASHGRAKAAGRQTGGFTAFRQPTSPST
jgi:hypothetical protein